MPWTLKKKIWVEIVKKRIRNLSENRLKVDKTRFLSEHFFFQKYLIDTSNFEIKLDRNRFQNLTIQFKHNHLEKKKLKKWKICQKLTQTWDTEIRDENLTAKAN